MEGITMEEVLTRQKELKQNYEALSNSSESLKTLKVFAGNNFLRGGENLTLYQKRIIALAIAQIQVEDRELTPEEFSAKVFTINASYFKDAFSLKDDNSNVFLRLKEACSDLAKKTLLIHDKKKNEEMALNYLDFCRYINKQGKIVFQFTRSISVFLTQLKKNYASYNLFLAYSFKRIHSIKIFEILQTQKVGEKIEMDWDYFKMAMGIYGGTGYRYPTDVKNKILKPVQEEMEKVYGIKFEFSIEKDKQRKGKYVVILKADKDSDNLMEWLETLSFDKNEGKGEECQELPF